MAALEHLRDAVGERLGLRVGRRRVERDVDLHALGARGLGERLEPEVLERLAQPQRHLGALDDRRRRPRIEVEGHDRRRGDVDGERERGVQLEVGEVGQPHERRQVVGEAEVDRARVVAAPDRRGHHPVRAVARALLLVEVGARDAVGVALERQRAPAQVAEQHRRDAGVVVDHLPLGEPGLGIEDLVEVRQREPAAVDVHLEALGHGGDGSEFARQTGFGSAAAGLSLMYGYESKDRYRTTPRRSRAPARCSSSISRRRMPPSRRSSPTSAPTSR